MYKTIRHGENSLQYTILPQNDDFRMEGKLSSASAGGSRCGSRKYKAKHPRRSRCAYLGLIFVCTVIVGAVLIPFLISAECLPNPRNWFLNTRAALIHNTTAANAARLHGAAGGESKTIASIKNVPHIRLNQTVNIIKNSEGDEKIILHNKKKNILNATAIAEETTKSSEEILHKASETVELYQPQQAEAAETTKSMISETSAAPQIVKTKIEIANNENLDDNFKKAENEEHVINKIHSAEVEDGNDSIPKSPAAETQLESQPQAQLSVISNQNRPNNLLTSSLSAPRVTSNNNINMTNNAAVSTASISTSTLGSPNLSNRIIQVPLLKSAAKKPNIPPVLVKTTSNNMAITVSPPAAPEIKKPLEDIPQQQQTQSNQLESTNEVIIEKSTKHDWIHSHWPYIDPSTYFQWTVSIFFIIYIFIFFKIRDETDMPTSALKLIYSTHPRIEFLIFNFCF